MTNRTNNVPAEEWLRWLTAGTFDICYATGISYLRNGTPPSRVLQFVASGLIGANSFQGGAATAVLGLALHYFNAFLFTAFFFAIASLRPALFRNPVLTGAIYGAGIYAVMNYVVVPLSRIGPRPTPPAIVWTTGLFMHTLFIGVPIALAARAAFARQEG
jgi:hypothetical protein